METDFNKDAKNNAFGEGARHLHQKASVLGVVVVIAGLLLLARNTGFLDYSVSRIIFSWEMLLIAIGVVNLLWKRSLVSGLLLIGIGMFFLGVNFYHMPFSTWQLFLPALIIIVGLNLIFGPVLCKRKPIGQSMFSAEVTNDDFFEDVSVFGGGERKIVSSALKGGRVIAIFGGSKIDLSHTSIAGAEKPVIEVVAIFGGTNLMVPSDWNLKVEVFNIFGGYSDKRITSLVNTEKTVTIKGVAIFGGGEIRSF